jgi:hypothetical protein
VIHPQFILDLNEELIVDNFAGGGGASTGIEMALGRHVDHAINHSREALGMHRINHPQTIHHCEDVFDIDPRSLCEGRPVGLAHFSPDCLNRETVFSPCRLYRYTLWRDWERRNLFDRPCGKTERAASYLMVIGLNPSTADETNNDPTIRRCIDFAKRWGFGALCMTNLFAWRDTRPANMKKAADPVGPLNDYYLFEVAKNAGMILAAWGKCGAHRKRAAYLRDVFREAKFPIHRLRLNNDGSPEHPLYIPADTVPALL